MDVKWLQSQFPDLSNFKALAPTGQKEVFAADHKLEGAVVLKIFKPGSDVERIEREMASPLKVNSSRIPKVAELGRTKSPTGEIVWLREKRIDGQSLKELLEAKERLDAATTIRIALHVVEVLAAGEAAEVVHRDIKPGNIVIDLEGSAWVIDFGLARHLDMESVTPTGQKYAPCTPGYAPIEQFTKVLSNYSFKTSVTRAGMELPTFLKERFDGCQGQNELQDHKLERI